MSGICDRLLSGCSLGTSSSFHSQVDVLDQLGSSFSAQGDTHGAERQDQLTVVVSSDGGVTVVQLAFREVHATGQTTNGEIDRDQLVMHGPPPALPGRGPWSLLRCTGAGGRTGTNQSAGQPGPGHGRQQR